MPAEIGRLTSLGLAKESTRLTAESSASTWVPWRSLTIDDAVEQVTNDSAVGLINDSVDAQVAKQMSEGSVEAIVGIDTIDPFLQNVMGSVSTANDTPEAGVDTDTYTVSQDNTHPTYTIFYEDGNETRKVAGAMFNGITIEAQQNSYVTVNGDFMANPTESATVTTSYAAETNFISKHVTVEFASSKSALDDSGLTTVRQVSMEITQNAQDEDALGTNTASDRFNTQFSVSGSMTLLYNSVTFRDNMINDTKQAMRLTIKNDDVTIGGSTNPEIQIDLNRVKFSSRGVNREPNDIMAEEVEFSAHYDQGDSKEIEIQRIYSP